MTLAEAQGATAAAWGIPRILNPYTFLAPWLGVEWASGHSLMVGMLFARPRTTNLRLIQGGKNVG